MKTKVPYGMKRLHHPRHRTGTLSYLSSNLRARRTAGPFSLAQRDGMDMGRKRFS